MRNTWQFTLDYVIYTNSDGQFSMIPRRILPDMFRDSLWTEWERLMNMKARLKEEYRNGDDPPDVKRYEEEKEKLNDNIFLIRKQLDHLKEMEKRQHEMWENSL